MPPPTMSGIRRSLISTEYEPTTPEYAAQPATIRPMQSIPQKIHSEETAITSSRCNTAENLTPSGRISPVKSVICKKWRIPFIIRISTANSETNVLKGKRQWQQNSEKNRIDSANQHSQRASGINIQPALFSGASPPPEIAFFEKIKNVHFVVPRLLKKKLLHGKSIASAAQIQLVVLLKTFMTMFSWFQSQKLNL
jgi:hypothetical protein